MRAAPGFAPRAIARSSRRIDIAKKPSLTAIPRVAENGELRVNRGRPCTILLMARRGPGKWLAMRAASEPVAFTYLFSTGAARD